jgi:S-methylmethionine-dependent homocysteine/selenocysteine methylase
MTFPLVTQMSLRPLLLLDGAMGTELQRNDIDVGLPLWSARALIADPESVQWIHEEYIAAGTDIITTNTFRTTRRTFARAGLPDQSGTLTQLAVELALAARAESAAHDVLIAGSMAPLEDCYRPDLVPDDAILLAEHAEHAARLAAAGVDFLLLETMGTIREAAAACAAAHGTGKEFIVSFLCRPDGLLYGGETLAGAVDRIMPYHPTAFCLNCISPRVITPALNALREATDFPVGIYANVGKSGHEQGGDALTVDVSIEEYAAFALQWKQQGVAVIGGCCGTTPEYIRQIRQALKR